MRKMIPTRALVAALCAGVLLMGIGSGVAFAEFMNLEIDETTLTEKAEISTDTETFKLPDGDVPVHVHLDGMGSMALEFDEDLEEGTMLLECTYDHAVTSVYYDEHIGTVNVSVPIEDDPADTGANASDSANATNGTRLHDGSLFSLNIQCIGCGHKNPDNHDSWCDNCGAVLYGHCTSCGVFIDLDNDSTCDNCGEPRLFVNVPSPPQRYNVVTEQVSDICVITNWYRSDFDLLMEYKDVFLANLKDNTLLLVDPDYNVHVVVKINPADIGRVVAEG